MIRFGESQVQELLSKPETGMGYQTVEVTDLEGRIQRGAAVRSIRVIETSPTPTAVRERSGLAARPGEAKDAPIEETPADEVFKRFSAYANDRRIRPDGSLSAGTYATTEVDAANVKTGAEAVRRYALPNPAPASFVFTSRPAAKTAIQRGTVAPVFNQPGGGAEVIFSRGTQAGTTSGPDRIPD